MQSCHRHVRQFCVISLYKAYNYQHYFTFSISSFRFVAVQQRLTYFLPVEGPVLVSLNGV